MAPFEAIGSITVRSIVMYITVVINVVSMISLIVGVLLLSVATAITIRAYLTERADPISVPRRWIAPGLAGADATSAQRQQAIQYVIKRAMSQQGVPFTYGGGRAAQQDFRAF